MLASVTNAPFNDDDWIFEIKWDGYRAIAEVDKNEAKLYSRNGLNFQNTYPIIYESLQNIGSSMILDGEIVVFNNKGLPDFQLLQQYPEHSDLPIVYQVFDILEYSNKSLYDIPLVERKQLLKKVLPNNDFIQYCDHIEAKGNDFFHIIQKKNMEGIIAKEKNSVYKKGYRSSQWLKIKNQHVEEAVIVGYTAPQGSRDYFGALLLGQYKNKKLVYVGHSGTGFDAATLKNMYEKMKRLVVDTCPFEIVPKTNQKATWIKPVLVAQIKFTEKTNDGAFRHPVFVGERIDKIANEVTLSKPKNEMIKSNISKKNASVKREVVKKSVASTDINKQKTKEDLLDDYELKVGTKKIQLTNQQKIFWKEKGYTKGDLVQYYQRMSSYILPYLKNRPQSLHRFPNGIDGMSFYHKDAGSQAPDWVKSVPIFSESTKKEIDYILCNDKASLAYLNNLGCIELNPWNSRVQDLDKPDYMVIDLDPSARNSFDDVIEAAQAVKHVLDKCKITGYCKTSGSTGLHIYVPMNAQYHYEQVKNFAHIIVSFVEEMLPRTTTLERNLKKRGNNKIYLDYLQNRLGQTLASVYSVRPVPDATVSMPLEWKEVKTGLHPSQFTIHNALQRIEKKGDLFKPILGKGINLKKCITLLEQ